MSMITFIDENILTAEQLNQNFSNVLDLTNTNTQTVLGQLNSTVSLSAPTVHINGTLVTSGAGVPTQNLAAGSVYFRTDGDINTAIYYTTGGGSWFALTSSGLNTTTTSSQTLSGPVTFNDVVTTLSAQVRNIRVVTAAGDVSLTSTDHYVVMKKSVSANTQITLPVSPVAGRVITIKDGKGDANSFPITVVAAASGTIDGANSVVLSLSRASIDLIYTGSEWAIA